MTLILIYYLVLVSFVLHIFNSPYCQCSPHGGVSCSSALRREEILLRQCPGRASETMPRAI